MCQAFHLNNRTVDFYHRLCISLQAYLEERYTVSCTVPPGPDIIWENGVPPKYLGERRYPAFHLDYTTEYDVINDLLIAQ